MMKRRQIGVATAFVALAGCSDIGDRPLPDLGLDDDSGAALAGPPEIGETEGDGSGGYEETDGDESSDGGDGPPATCDAPWRITVPAGIRVEETALAHADHVLVLGNAGGKGWMGGFDRCSGDPLFWGDIAGPGVVTTYVSDLVVSGDDVLVAGTAEVAGDPSNGYVSRMQAPLLGATYGRIVVGSEGADALVDVTIDHLGVAWQAGTTMYETGAPSPWVVRVDAQGSACDVSVGGLTTGRGRALAMRGDDLVVLASDADDAIRVLTYDPENCPCGGEPHSVSPPIRIGTASTTVGAALVHDDQIIIAGWATDAEEPDNIYGVVAWIDDDGKLMEAFTADPTAAGDGYLQIATDGELLYAAGMYGWAGGDFANGTAYLDALPLPLTRDAEPVWTGAPPALDYIAGLTADPGPDGGLYIAGNTDGQGMLIRCNKDGSCG